MKLYEFEGLNILKKAGINVPFFVVVSGLDEVKQARKRLKFPIVAKVQVLSGGRSKNGGIKICTTEAQLLKFAKNHFGKEFPPAHLGLSTLGSKTGARGEEVRLISLTEKVEIEKEYYLSITYDTISRTPFFLFSTCGGAEIEVLKDDPEAIVKVDIDPIEGPQEKDLEKFQIPVEFAMRLWDAFWRFDCRLVEVNPLAVTYEGTYVACDAKVILDDAGLVRHNDLNVLPKGVISALPSAREMAARKIDQEDYRGSAGSTFIELPGDLAILASGGGASLLVMDSVVAAGGRPANYTEYSGNPSYEKVEKLTEITLSKESLTGCLVAGAVANFTDIFETFRGFVAGLRKIKPKPNYPIVIRRGGPRQKEAYEMLSKIAKKEGFDFHLFGPETPISVVCKRMVELSEKFKLKSQISNVKSIAKI